MTITTLLVCLAVLVVFAVAIWDLLRPVRSQDDRLRASLGPAKGHQEARWQDGDRED